MKYLVILFVAVISFTACKKDCNTVTMIYEQTQCADPWGYGPTDQETKSKLGFFLDSIGVDYSNLSFARINPGQVCNACFCKSGGVFTLKTTEPFVETLIEKGFQKK